MRLHSNCPSREKIISLYPPFFTHPALHHRLEPQTNDTYEMEIARLARVNPEILEIQQKSGLNKEDMQASMAQLKLLREKVCSTFTGPE